MYAEDHKAISQADRIKDQENIVWAYKVLITLYTMMVYQLHLIKCISYSDLLRCSAKDMVKW